MKVERCNDRESLNAALTAQLKHVFTLPGAVMLSGGQAALPAYRAVAAQPLSPAHGLYLLYSDERYVPATSEASNYRASLALVNALALPDERVIRVPTELPLQEAAQDYEHHLRELINGGTRICMGLLGMGADGHTASLFSPADLERARGHFAVPVRRPDGMHAVSVTPELLSRVERLVMVVVGAGKRDALRALLARDPKLIAWQAIEGCRNIEVWCEKQA